jgi:uncharacterized protein YjcR
MEVAGYTDLGRLLGVSANQVYMWHQRRARNGFPEMVAQVISPSPAGGRKRAAMFDIEAVLAWHKEYRPATGGAPKGNLHTLKHGKYVDHSAQRTPEQMEQIRAVVGS